MLIPSISDCRMMDTKLDNSGISTAFLQSPQGLSTRNADFHFGDDAGKLHADWRPKCLPKPQHGLVETQTRRRNHRQHIQRVGKPVPDHVLPPPHSGGQPQTRCGQEGQKYQQAEQQVAGSRVDAIDCRGSQNAQQQQEYSKAVILCGPKLNGFPAITNCRFVSSTVCGGAYRPRKEIMVRTQETTVLSARVPANSRFVMSLSLRRRGVSIS